ncbi:MAG: hypothetical protein JW889_11890 [Verrucomicrobia bacterium]|nr:hypothetical protein [Verrucomicrobiota bacterium]
MAEKKTNPLTVVALLGVIILAIILGAVLCKKPAHRERQRYDYTIYGIAADGTVYEWVGHTPDWPIIYQGKELLPLYVCEHGHKFPGVAKGVTAFCPECGSQNVGSYDEELHGPIDATKIKSPQ